MTEQSIDPKKQAWVTLATNDSYALGAGVLGSSLRRAETRFELVVMVTTGVSSQMRSVLETVFHSVIEVNALESGDAVNLGLLGRPELGITFTKLNCWRLVQYSKCVFLDADTMVLANCDELFERAEFSAVPDSRWPDCFNSGVFVFQPKEETYTKLEAFASNSGSFDGGDQGLLNSFFSRWRDAERRFQLPFVYNMVLSAACSYLPAFQAFGGNAKIVHFTGAGKPWLMALEPRATGPPGGPGHEHLQRFLQGWWDLFRAKVHPKLRPQLQLTSTPTVRSESHWQIAVSSALSVQYSSSGEDNQNRGLIGGIEPGYFQMPIGKFKHKIATILSKDEIAVRKSRQFYMELGLNNIGDYEHLERRRNVYCLGSYDTFLGILNIYESSCCGTVGGILDALGSLGLNQSKNMIEQKKLRS